MSSGNAAISVGTDDEAIRVAPDEQLSPRRWRHAPGHAGRSIGLHVPLELTQTAEDSLFGVIANGAGVSRMTSAPSGASTGSIRKP